jgi:hypothetical protein
MRWKRGLFRLWLVASFLWVALMALRTAHDDVPPSLEDWILVLATPPIVVLLIGWSLAWALSGFRNRDS